MFFKNACARAPFINKLGDIMKFRILTGCVLVATALASGSSYAAAEKRPGEGASSGDKKRYRVTCTRVIYGAPLTDDFGCRFESSTPAHRPKSTVALPAAASTALPDDLTAYEVLDPMGSYEHSAFYCGDEFSLLHQAVECGDLETVKRLFNEGSPFINRKNNYGQTLVDIARRDGNKVLISLFLLSPVRRAIAAVPADTETINSVLSQKDICPWSNAQDEDGCTLLHTAAESGNLDVVALVQGLLPKGVAGVKNNAGELPYQTALRCRAKYPDSLLYRVFRSLYDPIKYAEDPAQCCASIINLAAWRGHDDAVDVCIQKGSTSLEGYAGEKSPLHWAVMGGHTQTVRRLATACPSALSVKDEKNKTPLQLAFANENVDIIQTLLEGGARMSPREGTLQLHHAIGKNQVSLVRLLLHNRSISTEPCSTQSGNNFTALQRAAWLGHVEIIKLICSLRPDENIDEVGERSHPALVDTIVRNVPEVVCVLCEHGADVNKIDSDGWTALHAAVSLGHVAMVRLLRSYGADIRIKDFGGCYARDYAQPNNRKLIAALTEDIPLADGARSSGVGGRVG